MRQKSFKKALRQFIPTVPGKFAAEGICQKSFDAIFHGGKSYCKQGRIESFANYTQFTEFVKPGEEKMLKGEGKKGIKAKKGTNNHIYLVVYLKDRLVKDI